MTPVTYQRSKRDLKDTEDETEDKSDKQYDIDIIDGEVRRTVRQLRPPPVGQTSWGFNDQFEQRFLSTTSPESPFQSSYKLFNPHLTTPNVQSSQKFKNSAAVPTYQQQSSLGNIRNDFKSHKQSYNPLIGSPVTEFNKPYTIHTSFDLDDAQSQQNFPRQNNFAPSTPFYQLNTDQRPGIKPQQVDVDNLPENFSFYHIGNGSPRLPKIQQQQSPQYQAKLIPQRPVYFENKPIILRAVTPKNHIIQFSTIGGFFNNNPTPAGYEFSPKYRDSEKNGYVTHKPLLLKETKNTYDHDVNNGKYYVKQNFEPSQPYNPIISTPKPYPVPIISTPKPYSVQLSAYADNPFLNNYNAQSNREPLVPDYTNGNGNIKNPGYNKFVQNQPSQLPQKNVVNFNSSFKKPPKTKEYTDVQSLSVPKFTGPSTSQDYYEANRVGIWNRIKDNGNLMVLKRSNLKCIVIWFLLDKDTRRGDIVRFRIIPLALALVSLGHKTDPE